MAKFIERLRENKFIKEYLKNYELRTYISSGFSALFSLLFAGYNLYIGITFRAIWNLSIAGYFVITLIIKTTIDIFEIKWQKNKLEKQEKTKKTIQFVYCFKHYDACYGLCFVCSNNSYGIIPKRS